MRLRDEQGSALVLTVIIMMVLLFLGSALALNSLVEIRQAEKEERHLQAYYLARSGADAVARAVENHPNEFKAALEGNGTIEIESAGLDQLGITVSLLKCPCEACNCRVESTGCVEGCQCTVVLELLEKCLQPKFDQVIVAMGENCSSDQPAIELFDGTTIIGDVATNATANNSVQMQGASYVEGDLFVGQNADPQDVVTMSGSAKVTGVLANISEDAYYPEDFWPDFSATYDDDIVVNSNDSLYLDLSEGLQERRLKNFEIKSGGTVVLSNIGENGRLTLYVDNKFFMADGACFRYEGYVGDAPSPRVLTIYYAGVDSLNARFREEPGFYGSILVKEATVNITAGNQFHGSIFSQGPQNVNISRGTIIGGVIYAPKAKVEISSGVQTGPIVANQLRAHSNAKIIYGAGVLDEGIPEGIFEGDIEESRLFVRGCWRGARQAAR